MSTNYFVTAIDTDSGKTLASAIIVEALQADYWKPIQAGFPTDTNTVKTLVTNSKSSFFTESYLLKTPASPHAAAKVESKEIDLHAVTTPKTNNTLIIEGAGGVLVPLNKDYFVIDLAKHCNASIVVVANLYLGSINHTLLTLNYLTSKNYPIKGIIFNGPENNESQSIILHHYPYPCLLHIQQEENIDQTTVKHYAQKLLNNW